MNVLHRIVLPALNALFITTLLIYCMFLLIKSDDPDLLEAKVYRHVDWVNIPDEPEVIDKFDRPSEPEEHELPPEINRVIPKESFDVADLAFIPTEKIVFEDTPIKAYQSNQLTLVFAYPAKYPISKLNRDIEGFVSVGFSVNPVGEVYDAFVIESEPVGAFEKSALKAIEKFRYKPRYENGIAVSATDQSYVFRYKIEK